MIRLFSVRVETRLSDLDLVCYVQHEVFKNSLVVISPVVVDPQSLGHQAYQLFIFTFQKTFDFGSRRNHRLHVLSQLREVVPVVTSDLQSSLLELQRDMCHAQYQIPGNRDILSKRNVSLMMYWLNVFEFTRRRLEIQCDVSQLIASSVEHMVCMVFDYDEDLRKPIIGELLTASKSSLPMETYLDIPVDRETQAYIDIHRHVMESNHQDNTARFYQHVAKLMFAPENEYVMPVLMCSGSAHAKRSPAGVGKTTFLDIMHEALKKQSHRVEAGDITDRRKLTSLSVSPHRIAFVDDMTMELLFGKPTVQDLIKKFLEGSEPFKGMRTVMTANVNLLASYIEGAEEHNEKALAAISRHRQMASCHIPAINRRFTIYNFKKILPSVSEQRCIDEMRFMPSRRLRFAGFLKRLYLKTASDNVLTPKWHYAPELTSVTLIKPPSSKPERATTSSSVLGNQGFPAVSDVDSKCAIQIAKMRQEMQSMANKMNMIYTELCEMKKRERIKNESLSADASAADSLRCPKKQKSVVPSRRSDNQGVAARTIHDEFISEKLDIDSFLKSLSQPKL
ncbi:hypothetical protein HDE_12945 [Halotydeus destructor]|nr:hypothetical protein HDE_12945 [Halotydeus destructor]